MNNKGFTLIELLAVMVILLSISVVAVTNITASLKRTEDSEYKSYENLAINAAKIYFSMETNSGYVQISTLISKDYLKKDEKYSQLPKTGKKLKDKFVVICNNKTKYAVKDNNRLTC